MSRSKKTTSKKYNEEEEEEEVNNINNNNNNNDDDDYGYDYNDKDKDKDKDDNRTSKNVSKKNRRQGSKKSEDNIESSSSISAKGDLQKFNGKTEKFQLLITDIVATIADHNESDFKSFLTLSKQSGEMLIREPINNELSVQYDKKSHSMIFVIHNRSQDRLDILSFVFSDHKIEEKFKLFMAIKLYEANRQESFSKLLKKKDVAEEDSVWLGGTLEVAPDSQECDVVEDIDNVVLDSDVIMRDCTQDYKTQEEEVNNDNYEIEEEVEERKNNNPQKAYHNKDIIFDQSLPFDGQNIPGQRNKSITGSKCFNRSYLVRETPKGSFIGFYKHNEDEELEYQGRLQLTDLNHKTFVPSKVVQHYGDRQMLLLSDKKPGTVSVLNLERGKIVEEWEAKKDKTVIKDLTPITKNEDMKETNIIYGIAENEMFVLDGRLPDKRGLSKQYATHVGFDSIATSGAGFIATGSDDGAIRLYDAVGKKAKTRLPGLGEHIKSLEVSNDGKWILATCEEYIMVIPTTVPGTQQTGFEGRGIPLKERPRPYILRLKIEDIEKYQLRKMSFTPAHFDHGKNIQEEQWIVSSIGPYIIKWNFRKVKKAGIVNDYSIRKARSKIVHNEFRFDHQDDLLISEIDSVYAQHSHKSQRK